MQNYPASRVNSELGHHICYDLLWEWHTLTMDNQKNSTTGTHRLNFQLLYILTYLLSKLKRLVFIFLVVMVKSFALREGNSMEICPFECIRERMVGM